MRWPGKQVGVSRKVTWEDPCSGTEALLVMVVIPTMNMDSEGIHSET